MKLTEDSPVMRAMITQRGVRFPSERALEPYIYTQKGSEQEGGPRLGRLPAHQIVTAFVIVAILLRNAQHRELHIRRLL